jgi:1,4-alpha-glucan branching enzyme
MEAAKLSHERHFGRSPVGFWLPECAYRPGGDWSFPGSESIRGRRGVEEWLGESGIGYFVVDTHLLEGGTPAGTYASRVRLSDDFANAPSNFPATGFDSRAIHRAAPREGAKDSGEVAFFTRDERTGAQVWSAAMGYPGDGRYLEFHKRHDPGGLRYWRVTGSDTDLAAKQPYSPSAAALAIEEHAAHFVALAEERAARDQPGACVCAPYDAELFGHWWFEGPRFLEELLRRASRSEWIRPATCSEALREWGPLMPVRLPEGSWGQGGRHALWLNEEVGWSWELIHAAERRMTALASRIRRHPDGRVRSVAAEAGRQLLLLEASDWQFLISTGGAPEYAATRLRGHADAFADAAELAERILDKRLITVELEARVAQAADRDRVFPELDPSWWATEASAAIAPPQAAGSGAILPFSQKASGQAFDVALQLEAQDFLGQVPRPLPEQLDLVPVQHPPVQKRRKTVRRRA